MASMNPWAFVVGAVVFGVTPGVVLRVLIRLYPWGHPRREELPAELYAMPQWRRPWFVIEQLETALVEALPGRLSSGLRGVRAFVDAHSPQVGLALIVVGPVVSGLATNLATEVLSQSSTTRIGRVASRRTEVDRSSVTTARTV